MDLAMANGDLEAARSGDRHALQRVCARSAESHRVINDSGEARQECLRVPCKPRGLRVLPGRGATGSVWPVAHPVGRRLAPGTTPASLSVHRGEAVLLRDLGGPTIAGTTRLPGLACDAIASRLSRGRAPAREYLGS